MKKMIVKNPIEIGTKKTKKSIDILECGNDD